jgi:hypothetical protein
MKYRSIAANYPGNHYIGLLNAGFQGVSARTTCPRLPDRTTWALVFLNGLTQRAVNLLPIIQMTNAG